MRKALVIVIIVLASASIVVFGTHREASRSCRFCGTGSTAKYLCGVRYNHSLRSTGGSKWVLSIYPNHDEHYYIYSSSSSRKGLFGRRDEADGSGSMVNVIAVFREHWGEAKARSLLDRYHRLADLPPSEQRAAFQQFRQEILDIKLVPARDQQEQIPSVEP